MSCISVLVDKEECRHNVCINNGTCSFDENGQSLCECPMGTSGPRCNIFEVEMFGLNYVLIRQDPKTWMDAQNDCISRGYNLTSVVSEEEHNFLLQAALVYDNIPYCKCRYL